MTREDIIDYWMDKAGADLASARDTLNAGRYTNAIRDAYFACFHAFSSVLFKEGISFKKHKEVRSFLHRDYIKNNRIDISWDKHYDWLFDNRQKADYRALVQFDPEQVIEIIKKSSEFVTVMKTIGEQDS